MVVLVPPRHVCELVQSSSTNRFENPEEFVPDRFPNRHVSFGLAYTAAWAPTWPD